MGEPTIALPATEARKLQAILERAAAKAGVDLTVPVDWEAEDARAAEQARARDADEVWQRVAQRRFVDATIAGLDADDKRRAADWFLAHPDGSLLLMGEPGRGKTWLAHALVRHAVRAGRTAAIFGMDDLLDAMAPYGDGPEYRRACRADVLVLDDPGQGEMSETKAAWLLKLLNARYVERRGTILTTNRLPAARSGTGAPTLEGRFPATVLSRLREDGKGFILEGDDRRRQ